MRYREGSLPDLETPYGESMHSMLTVSMWLSLAIGLALFTAGRYGKVLWLQFWSAGLLILSVLYLIADKLGYIKS